MNNTELIRELRALTSAGMKDCKDALEEAGWDLQKAVDIVKVKGLNFADGRSGRVASEGLVVLDTYGPNLIAMIEVNCQTDFVAKNNDFEKFAYHCAAVLAEKTAKQEVFSIDLVEAERKNVVASTKENVVVRRWWVEEAQEPSVRVFSYVHSNGKIGVLLTMKAPTEDALNNADFKSLGEDLAMQIAAMNPLAVSSDRIAPDELARQKNIFETQLKEENKPEKMWAKITEGKMNKWFKEVCLLDQESVVVPKTSVKQVIKDVGAKLGGEIQVVNFVRCQVGEGIEKGQNDLAKEVSDMVTRAC